MVILDAPSIPSNARAEEGYVFVLLVFEIFSIHLALEGVRMGRDSGESAILY